MNKKVTKAAQVTRTALEKTDAVVRKFDVPLMSQALAIQQEIFDIADSLGLGEEARAAVYALRTINIGAAYLANAVPAGAMAAASSTFGSLGGVAALGGVAVIGGVILTALFGGKSDAEKQSQLRSYRGARDSVKLLLTPLDIKGFIAEQETIRATNKLSVNLMFLAPKERDAARKRMARAEQMIEFYRRIATRLPPAAVRYFECVTNLGRWAGAKLSYSKKNAKDLAHFAIILDMVDGRPMSFGLNSGPSFPARLDKLIAVENGKLKGIKITREDVARLERMSPRKRPPPDPKALAELMARGKGGGVVPSSARAGAAGKGVAVPAALGVAAMVALGPIGGLIAGGAAYALGLGGK